MTGSELQPSNTPNKEQPSGLQRARDALKKGGQGLAASGRISGQWVRDSIAAAPAPAPTMRSADPWKCTLAGILARRPDSPLLKIKPLTLLDRFGAVHLDSAQTGFDGEQHDWTRITGIRLREAFELLTTDALEREVDRIRPLFPPVPGRKRALTFLAENLATVLLAALDQGDDALGRPIIGEVNYKGRLPGKRTQRPGLFAAAFLSLRPDINQAFLEEAERHSIPLITPNTSTRRKDMERQERISVLRQRTEAIIDRLNTEEHEPEDAIPSKPPA